MKPQSGNAVLVYHRVTTAEGEEIESSYGRSTPFRFTVDSGRVIKGMNEAIKGIEEGESTTVMIPASLAHGGYDEQKFRAIRKTQFFQGVKVGQTITFQGELGEPREAKVLREDGDVVIIDTNHPLAGKDLILKIQLVKILEDTTQEPFI